MSSAPAKFKFDLDLSGNQSQTRVMTENGVANLRREAREEGYAEGYREGQNAETARAAAALAASAEKIATSASSVLQSVANCESRARTDGIAVARSIAVKLASQLVSRMPEAELDALIEECLHSLDQTPHLVIRCQPDLVDKIKEITEAHMAAAGFNGRLVVLGDPEIGPGDGRLEWADGGLVRDMNKILAEIDRSITAYCATSGLPAPDLAPDPLTETDHE